MVDVEQRGPSVLAVVVTHDPGRWFGETLDALAAQDHPFLDVVVLDTGDGDLDELTARVRAVLPDALVHRVAAGSRRRTGFGQAVNEALELVDDVDYLLLCHDDIAPDRGAVHAMLAAAQAWDAAVVGPKLVAWDEPRRLLQMGLGVDRVGTPVPFVEPGDLDQGQHDAPREVFAVPGACTLVDSELFSRIGGFDQAIDFLGDDLSLCWRARVAGARVLVAPDARVRHRQGLVERIPEATRRRMQARHRLRVVLTCYGAPRLLAALPRLAAGTGLEVLRAVAVARPSRAAPATAAWSWNLRRLRSSWVACRQRRRFRRVPDRAVVRAQLPGVARAPLSSRRRVGDGGADGVGGLRPRVDAVRTRWTTGAAVVAALVVGLLAMGSRHLLTRGVPAVGQLLRFGPADQLAGDWTRGLRDAGGWPDTTAPTLVGAVGSLGSLLLGHGELLRTALTVGLIPLGVLGAFRLLRPSGSPRAPAIAALAYAAVPVPYAALAHGRWAPLVVYAAAPWLLADLVAAGGDGADRQVPGGRRFGRAVLRAGLVTALAAMVVPAAPLLLVGMGGALAIGALLGLAWRAALRLVVASVGGAAVAVILHLPWSAEVLRSLRSPTTALVVASWPGMGRTGQPVSPLSLAQLTTGTTGTTLTCGLLGAAGVILLVGRRWRLVWGVRAWALVLCTGVAIWAAGRSDRAVPTFADDTVLVVAGVGLAFAIGLGVVAVEVDVAGRGRLLGLRRLVTVAGTVAFGLAVLPLLVHSFDGDWGMPRGDFGYLLATHAGAGEAAGSDGADGPGGTGSARVLWVGDSAVLPSPGWTLSPDAGGRLAYLTTRGAPQVEILLPGSRDVPTAAVGTAVEQALAGETTRLGAALAAADIRYVVVPLRLAPSVFDPPVPEPTPSAPAALGPDDVVDTLAAQLDLRRVDTDAALVVYENRAASPLLTAITGPWRGAEWSPGAPTVSTATPPEPTSTRARLGLLGLQASLWFGALVVLARRRVPWRRSGSGVRTAAPRETVRVILPEAPRGDFADMMHDDLTPVGVAGGPE